VRINQAGGTYTDTVTATENGNYVFRSVPPGTYTVVFSKSGYAREVEPDVVVSPGQLAEVNATLTGSFTRMDDYVVQELRLEAGSQAALLEERMDSPALMDMLGEDLISQSGAGDAASALKLVPGATVQDDKAVVRGLPDRYVRSLLNGVRLPSADPETRSVELDQFPSSIIESVQVTKTFTPDQQGDASGGAVNVVTKSIPDRNSFSIGGGTNFNTQAAGNEDFLTYQDQGLSFLGKDGSRQSLGNAVYRQEMVSNDTLAALNNLNKTALGTTTDDAPFEYDTDMTATVNHELVDGVEVGGLINLFRDRSASFFDNGINDSRWLADVASGEMTPQTSGPVGDRKTSLLDITQGSEQVQWGGLGSFGLESEQHAFNLSIMQTRTVEDTAILAEDTRGKQAFYPGHDPNDPTSPGFIDGGSLVRGDAPFQRLQTLTFVERTVQSLQASGEHTLPLPSFGSEGVFRFLPPEVDWTVSWNEAEEDEPDKRQFGSRWLPPFPLLGIPEGEYAANRPGTGSANLGNIQRTFENTLEEGEQYAVNLELPFTQWSDSQGSIKLGLFADSVERRFRQESFSNLNQGEINYEGPFDEFLSDAWPDDVPAADPLQESESDTDYDGQFDIDATYWMVDFPATSWLRLIGGARFESTDISITTKPEEETRLVVTGDRDKRQGTNPPFRSRAGAWQDFDAGIRTIDPLSGLPLGDSEFQQDDVLPSIALAITPPIDALTLGDGGGLTFRASYAETVARQTFRELSMVKQQEFLGGDVFIGNPNLQMSAVKNHDLRLDYRPYAGGLVSVSWFQKDVKDPIELVQRLPNDGSFIFTTPLNFPSGEITGWEFEVRQDMERFWKPLRGLSVGANATFIDSQVDMPASEVDFLQNAGITITERQMVNAPERLLNFNVTYDLKQTGTKMGLFYTVQGDTLVAGPTQDGGIFIPSVFAKEHGTLNFTLSQKLGKFLKLSFSAKNLTDPKIQEVYRSDKLNNDVVKTSFTKGIDFSVGISADFKF
jgi:outer membrane receptor for ferrienterochelin and colicin